MSKKDLTGMRIGRLTVIGEAAPLRSPQGKACRAWECRCGCGNVITVRQNALTSQKRPTQSCGCLQREKAAALARDITGQRFGRLTAIRRVEAGKPYPRNSARTKWLCRCDCGNEVALWYAELLNGVQSCGCLRTELATERINKENVLGRYDGTLVSAIQPERGPNKNNKSGIKGVYWNAREGCWIAKIGLRRKTITLGRFGTLEKAAAARKEAEEKYYAPIIASYLDDKRQDADRSPARKKERKQDDKIQFNQVDSRNPL